MEWWDWTDPTFALAFSTGIATLVIPIILAVWAWRGSRRTEQLHSYQAESLARQEEMLRRQRRDQMLEYVPTLTNPAHLQLAWGEVRGTSGDDGRLLRAAIRSNPHTRLPGTRSGVPVDDIREESAADDYMSSLDDRYANSAGFPGLVPFVEQMLVWYGALTERQMSIIVSLVTRDCPASEKAGHTFYRELCQAVPELTPKLLQSVEDISPSAHGGLKLNVLTGALLACVDFQEGRSRCLRRTRDSDSIDEFRYRIAGSLAHLLHRNALRSLDRWELDGSTEPVSATVSWLVRTVGWVSNTDDHLAMRMIENLADAISSVPLKDRGWGIDNRNVRDGFRMIAQHAPVLWALHGDLLMTAADKVGGWREELH